MTPRGQGQALELDFSRMPALGQGRILWPWLVVVLLVVAMLCGGVGVAMRSSDVAAAVDQETVTRAETSLLMVPALPRDPSAKPVSHLLRQPVRLTDKTAARQNLNEIALNALAQFNYQTNAGDPLHKLLVKTLAEGQSDAYIDAALNMALSRGEFVPPQALATPTGDIDTARLLQALLAQVSG